MINAVSFTGENKSNFGKNVSTIAVTSAIGSAAGYMMGKNAEVRNDDFIKAGTDMKISHEAKTIHVKEIKKLRAQKTKLEKAASKLTEETAIADNKVALEVIEGKLAELKKVNIKVVAKEYLAEKKRNPNSYKGHMRSFVKKYGMGPLLENDLRVKTIFENKAKMINAKRYAKVGAAVAAGVAVISLIFTPKKRNHRCIDC